MPELDLWVGEAMTATITWGETLAGATLSFVVAESVGAEPIITKADGDFDKTDEASGIVLFPFTLSDLSKPGIYIGQFSAYYSSTKAPKSRLVTIEIKESLG
jgi:hypothetical protein